MPNLAKSPPELVARFDELAALVPDATRRQMFGYPSCVLGGHMFMSLFADRLILRLGELDRAEITGKHGATVFEPMPGRPMTGYMAVPPALLSSPDVEGWVARSHAYAATLPAKKPKAAKAAKTSR
jgi:TfoX/Sxy family transcriptional regulator of competence genes